MEAQPKRLTKSQRQALEREACRASNPVLRQIIRFTRLIGGWLLVVVGIAGLFLPILQGMLMIAIGLGLLSGESELIRRLLKWGEPYYRVIRWKWHNWQARRKAKKEEKNRNK